MKRFLPGVLLICINVAGCTEPLSTEPAPLVAPYMLTLTTRPTADAPATETQPLSTALPTAQPAGAEPTPVPVEGIWVMVVDIAQAIYSDGSIEERDAQVQFRINLTQQGRTFEGSYVRGDWNFGSFGSVCQEAEIHGTLDGSSVYWELYYGSCCQDARMKFEATYSEEGGSPIMRGSISPVEPPPHSGCFLWYGDMIVTRLR